MQRRSHRRTGAPLDEIDQLIRDGDWFWRIQTGRIRRISDRRLEAYHTDLTQRFAAPISAVRTLISARRAVLEYVKRELDAERTRRAIEATNAAGKKEAGRGH